MSCSSYTKLTFIYYSICNNKKINDNDIMNLLIDNTLTLPEWFISNQEIKGVIKRNFSFFFQIEPRYKMNLLDMFKDDIEEGIFLKYKSFLDFYNLHKDKKIDIFITNLINLNEEDKLLPYINDNLSYLDSGTTTSAYINDNQVLKLTLQKYEPETVRDLFLLAPTEIIKIDNNKNNIHQVIEIQSYLPKKKNGIRVRKREIARFLAELEKLGYYTEDPNNLNLHDDNFGYLSNYHDANITGIESYEDLPKWFKKRPLVLYDIDVIYKKKI